MGGFGCWGFGVGSDGCGLMDMDMVGYMYVCGELCFSYRG